MPKKEYISREAAKEELCRDCEACGGDKRACTEYRFIQTLPAADVRPVVLCKDCRHRDPEDHKCDCGQLERAGCVFSVADDYFCAYGER